MAKIEQGKNGKWQTRLYLGNGNYKRISGKTKNEVKAKIKKALYDFENKNELPPLTVRQAVENYIESKSNILSPATIRGYCSILRNKFKDIADIQLEKITQLDVQFSVNAESAKSSPKTVRNIYFLVFEALKIYNIYFKITFPKKVKKEVEIPTIQSIQKLFKFVENTEMEIPIKLAAMAGLRRSEICALQWKDIDFKKRTISIERALVMDEFGSFVVKTTKSFCGTRKIPIAPPLYDLLFKNRGLGNVTNLKPQQISLRFYRLQTHVSESHMRFHDLRHFFASVALLVGMPDKYAMKIVGHSTVEMLKKYQHTFNEEELFFYNKICNFFSDLNRQNQDLLPQKDDNQAVL